MEGLHFSVVFSVWIPSSLHHLQSSAVSWLEFLFRLGAGPGCFYFIIFFISQQYKGLCQNKWPIWGPFISDTETCFKMCRKIRLESQLKTYWNIIPLLSQSHGTIEQLESEGALEIIWFHGEGCYLQDQFAQGHIQPGLGQGWSDSATE